MARYYQFDVARWEGEGGSPGDLPLASEFIGPVDGIVHRRVAFLRMLSGVLIIVGSFIYARRKGWI